MSIFSRGAPVTSTASLNVSRTRIVSPVPYDSPLAGRDDTSAAAAACHQYTSWAESAASPSCDRSASVLVAAERIVPPLSSRVFASTAVPRPVLSAYATV